LTRLVAVAREEVGEGNAEVGEESRGRSVKGRKG